MTISSSTTVVKDASITANGSAQTALAANPYRNFLMLMPSAHTVTYSFTNASVAAGATGCFSLGTTAVPLIFQNAVPNGPVYVICTNADVVPIIEGSNA